MSVDTQQFLDMLSSGMDQVKHYGGPMLEYVDKAVDKAADQVRDQLSTATWVPEPLRPHLQPNVPTPPVVHVVPLSTTERVSGWFSRNKYLTTAVVLGTGYVTYRAIKYNKSSQKSRRAKRARNGGRLEVVVIAGSPTLPLTKSLALDLERRGFIVYIVANSIDDEVAVQSLSRPDIKPLSIDITDPLTAGLSIEKFAAYLRTPHRAVPGAKHSYLSLKSIVLIPSLSYQTSPIATIPPSNFADLFNTHLLHPILTVQSFLPLLTSRLTPSTEEMTMPKVLVFTPSIISSINPPFHAPEATVCSALTAFTDVLSAELRPLNIPVTHMQLGTFDFTGFVPARGGPQIPGQAPPAETLQWPEAARHNYGRNYVSQSQSAISAGKIRGMRGSSLRDLHRAVFDVMDGSETGHTVQVGLGAGLYGFVGRWAPRGLVSWMMGIRKVDELSTWTGPNMDASGSEDDSSDDDDDDDDRSGSGGPGSSSEFIPIPGNESGIGVWGEQAI